MQVLKYVNINLPDHRDRIRQIFFNDGIIIYPTDTLYGLGGHFFSPAVGRKLDTIKGRSTSPYSVAVSGLQMLNQLVKEIPKIFQRIFQSLLPGNLTLLFHASEKIDPRLLKNSGKIGIRIPDKPRLLAMIHYLDSPIITTSVNLTGSPPLNDSEAIRREFSDQPIDLLIDEGSLGQSLGSTIVDLTRDPPRVLREGDQFSRIKDILKSIK
jgi:L-threonylcarbamoyladenylate synthase